MVIRNNKGQFVKGEPPKNKGIPMNKWMYEKMNGINRHGGD